MMRRVILDTCVLTAALRSSHGASNAVLRLVAQRQLIPLISSALFYEYEEVLNRPEQRKAHGFDEHAIGNFLDAFASAASPVEIRFRWRPQLNDPGDEMVLEAAVNGQADGLITHNERDFLPAASRFGIIVMTPGKLLHEVKR